MAREVICLGLAFATVLAGQGMAIWALAQGRGPFAPRPKAARDPRGTRAPHYGWRV